MPVEIKIDPKEVERAFKRLEKVPYALQRAILPAVTEVLGGVKSNLAAHLTSEVPLAKKAAGKAVKLGRTSVSGGFIRGEVNVSSRMIPLVDYDAKPQTITARKGVRSSNWPDFTYSLRRGQRRGGRSRIEGISLPFIARMSSGHLGVYYRASKTSIKQAYGPTVQYHVATPEVEASFARTAELKFPAVLNRYVEQALASIGI